MRRRLLGLLLPITVISAAWAVARVDAVRRVVLPAPPAAEAQLGRPVGDLRIDGANFEQVLEILRQRTGAKITVDREAIATIAGSPADVLARPLELHLRDMTLGQVLGRLCAAADPERLTYVEAGDAIVVTTRGGLDRYTCVRVYDIRDMLPPEGTPGRPRRASNGLFGNQQQQLPMSSNLPLSRDEYVDEVIQAIMNVIASDEWADNGGGVGSVREVGGRLIIRQTPGNQRAIGRLLEGLRWRWSMRPKN
jgi:hypothetical protein